METRMFELFKFQADDPSLADQLNRVLAKGVAIYQVKTFQRNQQNLTEATKLKNYLRSEFRGIFDFVISSNKDAYEAKGGQETSLRMALQRATGEGKIDSHKDGLIKTIQELDDEYRRENPSLSYSPILDLTIPWSSVKVVQIGQVGGGEKLG